MTERTSDGFQLLPEGQYVFKAVFRAEKIKKGGSYWYKIRFVAKLASRKEEDFTLRYSQNFFPSDIKPLLVAMGFQEDEEGHVEWELEDVKNKTVIARIDHEPDKNNPDKKWARMKDIREVVPDWV